MQDKTSMNKGSTSEISGVLKSLAKKLPEVASKLNLEERFDICDWARALDRKLISMYSPDFPLLVAICGGGSSGKSTLFNAMVGKKVSPTGGMAGINRKVSVAISEYCLVKSDFLSSLFEHFGSFPKPLKDITDLISPGPPVYVKTKNLPKNLVLLDTPDFDTGFRDSYTNREISRQTLEVADLFIYVFTNSNYSNKDNTDFITKVFTGIGKRHCFLVYRVYPGFSSEEITEHAMTVARNIYGKDSEKYVLGIYRADEDNSVAAGEKFMQLYAVPDHQPTLSQALQKIDTEKYRTDLLKTLLHDAVQQAQQIHTCCKLSTNALRLYLDALEAIQGYCVQEALAHFPMELVMKRFSQLWLSMEPGPIKAMRKTGDVIGFPFKILVNRVKVGGKKYPWKNLLPEKQSFKRKMEEDILRALNSLYRQVLSDKIQVTLPDRNPVATRMCSTIETTRNHDRKITDPLPKTNRCMKKGTVTFSVAFPPALLTAQEKLRNSDWRSKVESVREQQNLIISFTDPIDDELKELVAQFRKRMGFLEKSKQTLFALLNIVPATVAVSYIFVTGDPVGATGIKVKLTGLFGLQDLYALIAIPATTGLNKADRKQLETLLSPVAKTWLTSKMDILHHIFSQQITGYLMKKGQEIISESEPVLKEIAEQIDICKKATEA